MSKRILSMVLMLTLVLGSFSMAFADTTDTNAALTPEQKIDRLVELGFVEGHEGSEDLKLNDTITRAQSAVVTAKAAYAGGDKTMDQIKADIEKLVFYTGFTDVKKDNWATPYINAAVEKGIIVGFPDNTFKPQIDVKNKEIVTMMVGLVLGKDEKLTGNYPTNYITKAMDLGLLDGVKIEDYDAPATRQTVFEILFNAVAANKLGEYNVDKVIVLENNRVESIGANELVVEVIEKVQKADFVSESRKEGSQYRITVPAKVGEVENLLGKVVDLSYDSKKVNEAVSISIDDTYRYEVGSMKLMDNKLEVDGKTYTVSKAERFGDRDNNGDRVYNDERIFNTYINNEPFTYSDVVAKGQEKALDFGRVTIKNGKVLFIDAFDFNDIAPVKTEVKEDGKKTIVTVYNDVNDGGEKKFELENEKILAYKEGSFHKINKEDIKKLDVIHVGQDSKGKKAVVVRQDAQVNGTYDKVVEYKDGKVVVVVDGKEYKILRTTAKMPVYSPNSKEFFRLEANRASTVLKGFEKEKVTVLQDVNGDLQYIGGEIEFGEVVGLLERVVGKEARVLKNDNKTSDYVSTLDSKFDVIKGEATGHQSLQAFDRGDLVFTSINKDEIEKMTLLSKYTEEGLTTTVDKDLRYVTQGTDAYRVFDRTNVFVRNYNKDTKKVEMFATTLANVEKSARNLSNLKAVVITDEKYAKEVDSRYVYDANANIAHTIVFSGIKVDKEVNKKIAEVTSVTNKYQTIEVRYADGSKDTFNIDKSTDAYDKLFSDKVIAGDIVELSIDKNDDKSLEDIKQLISKGASGQKVASYNEKTKLLKLVGDSTDYYLTSETANFVKGSLEAGKIVAVDTDNLGSDKLVNVVVERSLGNTVENGTITKINRAENLILVDGKVLLLDAKVKLVDTNKNVLEIGKDKVVAYLNEGDVLTNIQESNGLVTEITLKTAASNVVNKNALISEINDGNAKVDDVKYTQTTRDILRTALNNAIVVRDNTNATQAEVNVAATVVRNAINGLKDVPAEGDVTAVATKGGSAFGVTEYTITLEGANLEDITDVLVNGNSKKAMSDLTDGVFSFRTDEKVEEGIKVVVNGQTIVATIK